MHLTAVTMPAQLTAHSWCSPALGARQPRRRHGGVCGALHVSENAGQLPLQSPTGAWGRLQLARRKIEVAVREEDYTAAAEAKAEVERLLERLPANKALLCTLLDRLSRPGAAPEERLTAIQQLGELGDMDAAQALAGCLHEGEEVAVAAEEALWAVFLRCPTPEVEAQMQQGVVLMRRPEQWDQALAIFEDMVRKAPDFPEAYNKRATCYYLLHQWADAIADCKTVLRMNPAHFACAAGLGMCCAALGQNEEAVAAFEHAVAINPRLKHLRAHIRQLRAATAEQQPDSKQQRRRAQGE